MLDSDIDTLFDVSIANPLVDDDSHGTLSDVVDDSGLAVVDFVWHTTPMLNLVTCAQCLIERAKKALNSSPLLNGSVCLDVDNISDPISWSVQNFEGCASDILVDSQIS